MVKEEILDKIKEIIGNENAWLVLFYKEKDIGAIHIGVPDGDSEKTILDKFSFRTNEDGTLSLWFDTNYGYCYYALDDCKIKTL